MTTQTDAVLAIVEAIFSQPTAPFHEEYVARRVISYLREWNIPFSVDESGNIIAEYRQGNCPRPLILMAHMDHPAFTLTASGGLHAADWTARVEGYVPSRYFDLQVSVLLIPGTGNSTGMEQRASVVGYSTAANDREIDLYLRLDDSTAAASLQVGDFGVWDLPAYQYRDGLIHGRAVDDLIGCVEMLLTLQRAAQEGWNTHLYAVFTRAEEVGLVGAFALLRSGILPRDGIVVSLEVSPVRPLVTPGDGPIIRVGDRQTTFSHQSEALLRAAAARLAGASSEVAAAPPFKSQRHLMSGGSCEGTAAVLVGYQATGLTLPLLNYHNMGGDGQLAPEAIDANDFLMAVALLQEATRMIPELEEIEAAARTAYQPSTHQLERLRAPFPIDR